MGEEDNFNNQSNPPLAHFDYVTNFHVPLFNEVPNEGIPTCLLKRKCKKFINIVAACISKTDLSVILNQKIIYQYIFQTN